MSQPKAFSPAGGVAVITGAASGLGAGLAHAAAAAGMTVIGVDAAADRLEAVAASIRSQGGRAHAETADIADEHQVDALARRTHERFGAVRLLVNNAAVEALGRMWEAPAEVWRRTLAINLVGIGNGLRAFIPHMIASGEPTCVANVASMGALGALPAHGVYLASKAGILAVTETLRAELSKAAPAIRVVAVLPGGMATRIIEDAYTSDAVAELAASTREHLKTMMDPMQAGRVIFDQLAGDAFWISNDPERLARAAKARGQQMAALRAPGRALG